MTDPLMTCPNCGDHGTLVATPNAYVRFHYVHGIWQIRTVQMTSFDAHDTFCSSCGTDWDVPEDSYPKLFNIPLHPDEV